MAQAEVEVWVRLFDCLDHFPDLTSFTAHEERPLQWVVEGKSGLTRYGLWRVDGSRGVSTPIDSVAQQAAASCNDPPEKSLQSVSSNQAQLLDWVASYDCFDPKPPSSAFISFQENPTRWVVEGRKTEEDEGESFYGLWAVDTITGIITPLDEEARRAAGDACFRRR